MDEDEVKSSISRRRIIKRAGVGAAIVWSAPVLTSLGSHAHAQASPAACGPFNCEAFTFCPHDPNCGCASRHGSGGDACWGGQGICNFPDQTENICEQDSDCDEITGPGSMCLDFDPNCTQCGGSTFCAQPCASGAGEQGGVPQIVPAS